MVDKLRTHRHRRLLIGLFAVLIGSAAVAVACNANPAASFRLDPVSASGANPFSPPVGTDQARVTPPANVSGTFPGNTAGLYGGTLHRSSCDQKAMVTFLAAHPDKAAAWAGVLSINPADISRFVGQLTPVLLRADTFVTNHGFDNGHATTVPAVLQSGTAVLVNSFGAPVTRCFCGNPLTPPPSHRRAAFVGTEWPGFNQTAIIVIQSTTVVINQFVLVQPATGAAFDRPSGTQGGDDQPSTGPSGGGAPSSGGGPPGFGPSGGGSSGPSAAGSPSGSSASWVVGNCFVDRSSGELAMRATVLVRNNDTAGSHNYQLTVAFGPSGARYGEEVGSVDHVDPGRTGSADVSTVDVSSAAGGLPDGPVACEITKIEDENGARPEQGLPIDAPSPVPPSGTVGPSTSEPPTAPSPSPS